MKEPQTSVSHATKLLFEIHVDHESGSASAVLTPSAYGLDILNTQLVLSLLEEHQVSHWHVLDAAIDDLCHKFKKNQQSKLIIAKRQDAQFQLIIAKDSMSATISVTPALGGSPLTEEDISDTLLLKRIDSKRVIESTIELALKATEPVELVIARGKPPKIGRDSQFKPLLDNSDEHAAPEVDEDGKVDFYAGRTYLAVETGTHLMERIPPQPGKVGMDIFGQIIPAESGKEIAFGTDLAGAEFDPNDHNLLVAKTSGHPVFFADGVRVDETLQFKNVSVATGHVTFDGSIIVTGDVMADMKISVTGDVFVKGVVERAHIQAGNDIHVAGGILGDTSHQIDEDALVENYECTLEAGGNISARYINISRVTAKNTIQVKEYAFHSKLRAGSQILLGQQGGKGNLVGGEAYSGHSIIVKMLGNKAYNTTRARVGISHEELQNVQKLRFLRDQRLTQARQLREILKGIKEKKEQKKISSQEYDKATKVHDSLLNLQQDIRSIDQRLQAFEFAHYRDEEPNISATASCFPNCWVTINGAVHKSKQEHKAICFVKRGRKITAK